MKEKIEQLLMSTDRHGICDLIAHMEMEGFFEAPCSGAKHLSKVGGLAEHSLNVYEIMKRLNKTLDTRYTDDTIILCAILHVSERWETTESLTTCRTSLRAVSSRM